MWRISRQINIDTAVKLSKFQRHDKVLCRRLHSLPDNGGRGKGAKLLLGIAGTTFVAVGGSVAYAKYDNNFRSWIESTIPLSPYVLGTLIGSNDRPKESYKPLATKSTPESIREKPITRPAIQPMREADETSKKKLPLEASPAPFTPSGVSQAVETKSQTTSATGTQPSSFLPSDPATESPLKVTDEQLQQRLTANELEVAAENAALEQILRETVQNLEKATISAVVGLQEAQQAVKTYISEIEHSLDAAEGPEKASLQNKLNVAQATKNDLLTHAEARATNAKELLEKTRAAISEGRQSVITAANPVLTSSEETLNRLSYQLHTTEAQTASAKSESNIMADYRDMLEKARQEFQHELQSFLPDLSATAGKKHTEEELNTLIAHAHRRIEQLQKQLALQQSSERQRFQQSMDKQRQEHERNVQRMLTLEASKQQQEVDVRFQQKVAEMRDELEHELRMQLRRQAAAHSDHMRDVLQAQHQELDTKYKLDLEEKVNDARHVFEADLARSYARLRGIEEGLKARAELNEAAKSSQKLWLACQSLRQAIKVGEPDASSWEAQLRPLQPEMKAIEAAAGTSSDFVGTVLKAIPDTALVRGIYPETALKERFLTVYRTCRRVALVGDNGGSLLWFALSYLQSVLVIDAATRVSAAELANRPVDPSQMTAFDVLTRARWCVERDDLEQALRFMNLLRGAPRMVASDWMTEVLLLLETRQAAEALITLSAATGVQAFA